MMSLLRQLPRLPVVLVAALCLLTAASGSAGCNWCLDGSGKARAVAADNGHGATEDRSKPTDTARAVAGLGGEDGNRASRCLDASADAHWRTPRHRTAGAKIALPPAVIPLDRAVVATPADRTFYTNLNLHTPPRTPDLILLQKTTVLRV